MSRAQEIAAFLATTTYAGAQPEWLAGDASTRRYARVGRPGLPIAVLMDAPAEEARSNRAFHAMTQALRAAGFSAPEIVACDLPRGLMLLEDLGPSHFAQTLHAAPEREEALYGAAVDLLADLHSSPALAAGLPAYDAIAYQREVDLLTRWYLRTMDAEPTGDPWPMLSDAIDALPARAPVCVLRDYHAENLIWMPGREGKARVGLLDYQDALAGHPAYDLVSLIEDARRDTSAGLQARMIRRFADASGWSEAEVTRAVAVLGAQRNMKILGIFARLSLRDGKPRYLTLMPRVWGHLTRDLSHPALAPLAAWVAAHVPAPDLSRLSAAEAGR